jgi:hypothetical protein
LSKSLARKDQTGKQQNKKSFFHILHLCSNLLNSNAKTKRLPLILAKRKFFCHKKAKLLLGFSFLAERIISNSQSCPQASPTGQTEPK